MREGSSRAKIYWVATGEEALDFLLQRKRFENIGPIRIVVLDAHLPGLDGFDVLRQIKSDPNLSRVPVILLSGATEHDEIDLAYSLGANACFKKPATLDSYVELLRIVVQHWLDLAQLPTAGRNVRLTEPHRIDEEWERESESER